MPYRRFGLKSALATSASAAVIALMTTNSGIAVAQEVVGNEDRITVTATKREESIQEVPLAITALDASFMADVNLNDIKDILLWTPGITGNSQDSFIDTISIRGILTNDFGVGGDMSVGFFKNNLYQGRNGNAVTTLYDMDRAEALRGPQQFLFGRNAIGGAISVFTARPELGYNGGYADVNAGGRGHIFGEGAFNVSASENFGFRVAGFYAEEDGWVDNIARPLDDDLIAHNKWGVRVSGLFENDNFEAFFFVEYEDRDQDGTVYRAIEDSTQAVILTDLFGLEIRGDGRDTDSDMGYDAIEDDSTILNVGLEMNWELGWATFTSITGYQDSEYFYIEDFDGTNLQLADYLQDQEAEYFQQEFRLTSTTDGPLSWYLGGSYYQEDIDAFFEEKADEVLMCAYYFAASSPSYYPTGASAIAGCIAYYGLTPGDELIESNRAIGDYHGWAGYVNVNYQITDRFDIGAGVRYSRDTKDFSLEAFDITSPLQAWFTLGFTTDEPITAEETWSAWSPQVIARYRLNDDTMVFASVTRGYKAGGFGTFSVVEHPGAPAFVFGTLDVTNADVIPDQFDPESSWSYEVGIKGSGHGGRLRYDANLFTYQYEDLQLVVTGAGGGVKVENVGEVDAWGIEGAIEYDFNEYVGIRLSGGHVTTEVTGAQLACPGDDPDACEGDGFSHVPDFSGSARINFEYPMYGGVFLAAAEVYGQTDVGANGLSVDPTEIINGYADITLRTGYVSDNGWGVVGYVENVTNELYYDSIFAGEGILPAVWFGPSRPRTFGVRLFSSFGD